MGGGHPASIEWFIFKNEPTYTITYGPDQLFDATFDSLCEQFTAQAFIKGSTTLWFIAFWKDGFSEALLDFFLKEGVIFTPGPAQDDDGNYYRINLFAPSSLDKHSDMFETLRQQDESDIIKDPIEKIAEVIRYARHMNYWLAFSFIDCS
ncbi:MAG: hypothetical protein WCK89_15060 [bacterium]